MIGGNEKYMNVVKHAYHDIVCTFRETRKKFIRELHGLANRVNTRPNSLGNSDSHKITFNHRQLHPSALGIVDLLESSKDVGQTGMLSPWMDNNSPMFTSDVNKYPNIEYDLFDFMRREFNNTALTFDCDNVRDFKRILDHLVAAAYVNIDIKIPEAKDDEENDV